MQLVDGLSKDDFLADKRTQQAVIMSIIILGEAATKLMDSNRGLSPMTVMAILAPEALGV